MSAQRHEFPSTHIRAESSSRRISRQESALTAKKPIAVLSCVCGCASLPLLLVFPAALQAIPLLGIVSCAAGFLAAIFALIAGLAGVISLRKSPLPRGRSAAWVGLLLGGGLALVIGLSCERFLRAAFAENVVSEDRKFSFKRPSGWLILPDKVFNSKSDAEIMAADGSAYAVVRSLRSKSLSGAVGGFLKDVYTISRSHGHHHHKAAHDTVKVFFSPDKVLLHSNTISEFKEKFAADIEMLKKKITARKKRIAKYEEAKNKDKALEFEKAALQRDLSRLARMESSGKIGAIVHYYVQKKLRIPYDENPRVALTPAGDIEYARINLSGVSESGKKHHCMALLWRHGEKCCRITVFSDRENLRKLAEDFRPVIASFRAPG